MKITDKSILLKVVSVLAAIVLWLVVVNAEDPTIDYTESEVNVNFVGEEDLNLRGLMIANKDNIPKVSAVIRGKRSSIINTMGLTSARVDLRNITGAGKTTISPDFIIPTSDVYVAKKKVASIDLEICNIEEKQFNVQIALNDEYVDDKVIEPIAEEAVVTLKGVGKELKKIDRAVVYIDSAQIDMEHPSQIKDYDIVFENDQHKKVTLSNNVYPDRSQIGIKFDVFDTMNVKTEYALPENMHRDYMLELEDNKDNTINVGVESKDARKNTMLTYVLSDEEIKEDKTEYEFTLEVPKGMFVPEDIRVVKVKANIKAKNITEFIENQEADN